MRNQPHADRPYHHGDLKNALIQAGLEVLAARGMTALNLREVARRAGVSHAAPYRHFANKEALLAAIAEDGFHQLNEAMSVAVKTAGQSAEEHFFAIGRAYVYFALAHPDSFRLMFSHIVGDRSGYPSLYRSAKVSFQALFGVLVIGQASGAFVEGDLMPLAESVWSMVHGLATLLVENQIGPGTNEQEIGPQALEDLVQFYLERVLSSIRR